MQCQKDNLLAQQLAAESHNISNSDDDEEEEANNSMFTKDEKCPKKSPANNEINDEAGIILI